MLKSRKILSHVVAWVNQFSKASPNAMTCKFSPPLSFLLLPFVSNTCSRREEMQMHV